MTDAHADRIGRMADKLDASLYATKLPGLDPKIHLEGLTGIIREARDELAAVVREVTGEDPWATNPLVG